MQRSVTKLLYFTQHQHGVPCTVCIDLHQQHFSSVIFRIADGWTISATHASSIASGVRA